MIQLTRSRDISRAEHELVIDLFNASLAVGDEVIYVNDDGSKEPRRTRSEAFMLGGHTPVVQLTGRSGCVALGRILIDLEKASEYQAYLAHKETTR